VPEEFEKLAKVLFDGKVVAGDFKTMPGTDPTLSRDQLSEALLSSMNRVGLIVDDQLVNEIEEKT